MIERNEPIGTQLVVALNKVDTLTELLKKILHTGVEYNMEEIKKHIKH